MEAAGRHTGWRRCLLPLSGHLALAVGISQLLSVALATTGVSSQLLTQQGIYVPTTQQFLNYFLLAVVFGTSSLLLPALRGRRTCTKQQHASDGGSSSTAAPTPLTLDPAAADAAARTARLRRTWPAFAALALLDVEANVAVTAAYRYTSLTSVTLLDCFTIPMVMLLSWALLAARYRPGHCVGAVVCITGLAVLVLGDAHATPAAGSGGGGGGSSGSGSAPLLGDALVLLGASLYAVCNVSQELLLAGVEPGELLALLGIFGALISGAQALALEHAALQAMAWASPAVLLPLLGFAAAMFLFYSLVPRVLLLGGATVLNLGLLSSDGWAALARVWLGGWQGWSTVLFFGGSLLLVACGLVLFTLSGNPKAHVGASCHDGGGAAPGTGADASGSASTGGAGGARDHVGCARQGVGYSRLLSTDSDVEGQHGFSAR